VVCCFIIDSSIGGTGGGGCVVGAVITVAFFPSIFSLRGVFDELFVDTQSH
jgi:hypothetical protein